MRSETLTLRFGWVVFLLALPLSAGEGAWTSGGPHGGPIEGLAQDPTAASTIYAAGGPSGPFKSLDSAGSWAPTVVAGSEWPWTGELHTASNGTLYASLFPYRGMAWSGDGGTTWATNTNITAYALAIHPSSPMVLYAAVGSSGVQKSTDGGTTWNDANTGLDGLRVYELAIDPSTPATLYAGTGGDGIYKSVNGGDSWAASNTSIDTTWVTAIAVDPTTPTTLYIGTRSSGVFKSIDGGAGWGAKSSGLPTAEITALKVDPNDGATVFAGSFGKIHRTQNGGDLWSEVASGADGTEVNVLLIDPTSVSPPVFGAVEPSVTASSIVYAGTSGGVLKSGNGGTTWAEANSGLTAFRADSLEVDQSSPTTAYVAGGAGLAKTIDNGVTWQAMNIGLPLRSISGSGGGLALAASQPLTLYANLSEGPAGNHQIFKTVDGAANWSTAIADTSDFGLCAGTQGIHQVAVNPTDPDTAFAGMLFPGFCDAGVFRTTNGGTDWVRAWEASATAAFFQPNDIQVDPTGSVIFVGALDWPDFSTRAWTVLRSIDGGATFSEVLSGTDFNFPEIAIDPLQPANVYVAIRRPAPTLFRSIDGGGTWVQIDPTIPDICFIDIAADPFTSGTLWTPCLTSLYLSTDSGSTWLEFDDTGTPYDWAREIEIAMTAPRTLHVGGLNAVYSYSASVANLTIEKEDGVVEATPGGAVTYSIEVANPTGPDTAIAATVTDDLPAALSCSWTCVPTAGASCTAMPPAGDLDDIVTLPKGASVTYTASCTIDSGATGTLTNTASVTAPEGLTDVATDDNTATDSDLLLVLGPCGHFLNRDLDSPIVTDTQSFTACNTIKARDGFGVSAPGNVTLTAGQRIELYDGFFVGIAATFKAEIDPMLATLQP